MAKSRKGAELLVVSELGYGKRTDLANYRAQTRGGIGIKTVNVTAKNGPLVGMAVVEPQDQLIIITAGAQIIRQRVDEIRETGRSAQGVRLIRLQEKDRVASIAIPVKDELEVNKDDQASD
jgi:DNA gyrase subunit A